MSNPAETPIAVALDLPEVEDNARIVDCLGDAVGAYKVGLSLFYRGAGRILDRIRGLGVPLFLDLKLHDIPATVAGAASALGAYQPALITVHAAGGATMVQAAVDALAGAGCDTKVIAVTLLTSLDRAALATAGLHRDPAEIALALAEATEGAAHGWVCSPHEVQLLRARWPDKYLVVPGIRDTEGEANDQRRTATAAAAARGGASLLVVGRPITHAPDPGAAFARLRGQVGGPRP